MSAIEDTRRVLQDFLAPELRAIGARLDAIDSRLDQVDKRFDQTDKRFDQVEKRFSQVDSRFEQVEKRAEERHAEVMRMFAAWSEIRDVRERLARLEGQRQQEQQPAA